MRRTPVLLLFSLVLPLLPATLAVASGETVEVVAAAELRAQPGTASASRGRVEQGARGERLGRDGGWVLVGLDEREGWLRVWQVRAAAGQGNALLRGLERFSRGVAGLFGERDDAGQQAGVTATIGVRGLDAGEFAEAAPDADALRRVRGLRAHRDEAAAFAREAGLSRRRIAAPRTGQQQNWEDW